MAIRVPLDAHDSDDGANGRGISSNVAFAELWQHRAALRDICQRIVGDAATADDVVQETYLRALRNLDRLEQRPTLMPWLATVARRRSIDELRRRQYQRPVDAMPDASTKPEFDPGEAAGVSETVSRVREALTALTDRERELLMRQVNQGLSLSELAALDNSSVASVRSVLSRARTKLRDALTDTGVRISIPLAGFGARFRDRMRARLGDKVGAVAARAERVVVLPGGVAQIAETATAAVTAAVIAIGGLGPATAATAGGASGGEMAVSGVAASATGSAGIPDSSAAPSLSTGSGRRAIAADASTPIEFSAAPEGPRASDHSEEPGGGGNSQGGGNEGGLPPTPPQPNPPDPNNQLPPADDPPEDPGDTYVKDITFAGEGLPASNNSSQAPIYVLGEYQDTECEGFTCDAIFRSDDGGKTWTTQESDGLVADAIMVPPDVDDDGLIVASGSLGIMVSTDQGDHFSVMNPVLGPPAMSPAFSEPGDHDSVFVGGGALWDYDVSDDRATPLGYTGLVSDTVYFGFDPAFLTSGVVFGGAIAPDEFGQLAPSVHRCVDGDCSEYVSVALDAAPRLAISSDYEDDHVILAWAGSRLLRSAADGQLDFTELDLGIREVATIVAAGDDRGGGILVAVDDVSGDAQGLMHSADGGQTWSELGVSTLLSDGVATFAARTSQKIFAAPSSERGLYCSKDAGVTWSYNTCI